MHKAQERMPCQRERIDRGELSMNKKNVVSIVIGLLLTATNTVVTIATREDWLTSTWLLYSNGVIAIVFFWPSVFQWAWRRREKHKVVSYFIIGCIGMFSLVLCGFLLFE